MAFTPEEEKEALRKSGGAISFIIQPELAGDEKRLKFDHALKQQEESVRRASVQQENRDIARVEAQMKRVEKRKLEIDAELTRLDLRLVEAQLSNLAEEKEKLDNKDKS